MWASQPERHRDYWCVPSEEPIPESVQATGRMAAAIQQGDAAWKSEMDKITALIDAERPGEFKLSKELVTTEVLGRYVEKLLRLGESAVVSLEKMKRTARELDLLLKEALERYREMAELERSYGAEEKRAAIKQKYLMLGDIWEAKAKAAELHHGDVQDNLVSDLDDYLKKENLFLERLLTMLNKGLAVGDLGEMVEFRKTLEEIVLKHEFLRGTLQRWRERMVDEPVGKPPRSQVRKEETEGPAPSEGAKSK